VDLLARHHERKRRLEPAELIEQGNRVAVRLGVTDPAWSGPVEVFKVFTFRDEDDRVVLMQDCIDRESALAELAR
jgi:hypothetical protein